MKKHPIDIVALLFGVAFAVVGGAFLVYEATDRSVDPAWVTATTLILLGVIALVVTLVRGMSAQR